uniref:Uncharacterized protein n=1 Tax=Tetradesmus obliquus TaxID=3088 RepID=A0A383W2P3_TETOB|eukprot:jgi/Sobl393_1/20043/SZX71433.1
MELGVAAMHLERHPQDEAQEAAERALLALSIAIDHPALSTDPQVLCAAAQACKDWREAVQLCGVCNTAVVFDAAAGPAAQLQELAAQARRTDKELDSQRIACRLVRCMSNQGC